MPDLLDSIQAQITDRLLTLEPLVREYERLCEVDHALGSILPAGQSARRPAGGDRQRRRPRRPASTRAGKRPPGHNREAVLSAVRDRPGVTKLELVQVTALSPAGIAQNVRQLLARGELVEDRLPGGDTGYRATGVPASAGDAASSRA